MEKLDSNYWQLRYEDKQVQWDIGVVSNPLKVYFDQLQNKELSILIPGAGNAYEAEYLHNLGFKNVYVVDFAKEPLDNLKARVPSFPKQNLLQSNFFDLETKKFDLIIEQTFFCALNPNLRKYYASKMLDLLEPDGSLVGLLFNVPLNEIHPPFGGNKQEYLTYFDKQFDIKYFDTCYNSISPRANRELFIHLSPKK
jgi:thiopurine S-methyltransferase